MGYDGELMKFILETGYEEIPQEALPQLLGAP